MLPSAELVTRTSTNRTNVWLRAQLHDIWDRYFDDTPRANWVEIEFARAWKSRLGMIALSESGRSTYIGINWLFRFPEVPETVALVTVAHELVHYNHGFGSPLPRKYRYPHAGRIVDQELTRRGLASELAFYEEWTTNHWPRFYRTYVMLKPSRKSGPVVQPIAAVL